MAIVVDTNVPMVASRRTPQADERCVGACIHRLAAIRESGGLVVDDSGLIIREYTRNLGHSGQPGAGHAFAKWAHDHQAIPEKVVRVPVAPLASAGWRKFQEFPDDPSLESFDKGDQKFVAVARASGLNPPILHATDRGWWKHKAALSKAGVTVESLCPQHRPKD